MGLALAGGGPLGAVYEIGALAALQEALPDLRFEALDGYVGVSAGAIVVAGLANGITPRELAAAFVEPESDSPDRIEAPLFFRPAWREFAQRLAQLPLHAAEAAWRYAVQRRSAMASLEALGRVLPTGLFSSDALEARMAEVLSRPGRSNDFRRLATQLIIVATDLDSGQAVPFGTPGHDAVPISVAAAASAALPGLFPPVMIDGRAHVDGALKKTLHASVLLERGVELLFCLNPLVPFEAGARHAPPVNHGHAPPIPQLVDGGLPVVMSQTFRSLIHSRLELGIKGYESSHPRVDIVLFEPEPHDREMFLANIFSVSQRVRVAEHAYQSTRRRLRSQRSHIGERLARHGLQIDHAALDDPHRVLVAPPVRRAQDTVRRLEDALNDLEGILRRRGAALQPR
ncbi:MAG: patatin-like phospholipase family protein [Burkholderiaceae bacterium]